MNSFVKNRLLPVFMLICMLFSFVPALAGETAYITDESRALDPLEYEYLLQEADALNDIYATPAFILLTSGSDQSLKNTAERFWQQSEAGFGRDKSGLLLLVDTQSGEYWIYASGSVKKCFTGSVISSLKETALFPLYFEEGSWADGCDDFLLNVSDLFDAHANVLTLTAGAPEITFLNEKTDLFTLPVTLKNTGSENILIEESLSGELLLDNSLRYGTLNFKYRSVYAGETLSGTVSFELDHHEDYKKSEFVLTLSVRGEKMQQTFTAVVDARTQQQKKAAGEQDRNRTPDEHGTYTSREDVAAYIRAWGRLPDNYITKQEAQRLGWDSSRGNLWSVAPGKSIGGDRFGNYEGLLPGGSYTECDIDYQGGYRDSKRLVFRKDGSTWRIYYTDDHYNTFTEIK